MLLSDLLRPFQLFLRLQGHWEEVDHLLLYVWVSSDSVYHFIFLFFFMLDTLHNSFYLCGGQLRYFAQTHPVADDLLFLGGILVFLVRCP